MFYQNRFTERAAEALRLAQETAGQMGHSYVGSEHLLAGLAKESGGMAAKVLHDFDVTAEKIQTGTHRRRPASVPVMAENYHCLRPCGSDWHFI